MIFVGIVSFNEVIRGFNAVNIILITVSCVQFFLFNFYWFICCNVGGIIISFYCFIHTIFCTGFYCVLVFILLMTIFIFLLLLFPV